MENVSEKLWASATGIHAAFLIRIHHEDCFDYFPQSKE